MKEYKKGTVRIRAGEIEIGEGVTFGKDIDIIAKDRFAIGARSRLGDNIHIRGRNIIFGADLYHSEGLRIGGGGCDRPRANFSIGDRCTIHNNYINIAESVVIGDDVGLSPDVFIITHGFWKSVLDGFPAKFAPVVIENGAIIGQRSIIMMGLTVGENCVVGAHSVVTKSLESNSIYAGNPARLIRQVERPSQVDRGRLLEGIIEEYAEIARYHGYRGKIRWMYPHVYFDGVDINVETFEVFGEETDWTDDLRDHLRRYGIRCYTERPFKSMMDWS